MSQSTYRPNWFNENVLEPVSALADKVASRVSWLPSISYISPDNLALGKQDLTDQELDARNLALEKVVLEPLAKAAMQATNDPATKKEIDKVFTETVFALWHNAGTAASSRRLERVLNPTSSATEPGHLAAYRKQTLDKLTEFGSLVGSHHKGEATASNGTSDPGMDTQGTNKTSQERTTACLRLAERIIGGEGKNDDLSVEEKKFLNHWDKVSRIGRPLRDTAWTVTATAAMTALQSAISHYCDIPSIPWDYHAGAILGLQTGLGMGPLVSIPQSLFGGPWTKYATEVPNHSATSSKDYNRLKATSQDTGFISNASKALSSLGSKIQSFFGRGSTAQTQVTDDSASGHAIIGGCLG